MSLTPICSSLPPLPNEPEPFLALVPIVGPKPPPPCMDKTGVKVTPLKPSEVLAFTPFPKHRASDHVADRPATTKAMRQPKANAQRATPSTAGQPGKASNTPPAASAKSGATAPSPRAAQIILINDIRHRARDLDHALLTALDKVPFDHRSSPRPEDLHTAFAGVAADMNSPLAHALDEHLHGTLVQTVASLISPDQGLATFAANTLSDAVRRTATAIIDDKYIPNPALNEPLTPLQLADLLTSHPEAVRTRLTAWGEAWFLGIGDLPKNPTALTEALAEALMQQKLHRAGG